MKPEHLNAIAILLAIAGWATGIRAVGKYGLWEFESGIKPYLKGSARAWLYALVICTTIVSMWHMAMLADWFIQDAVIKKPIGTARRMMWMGWHCTVEAALISFHIWARKYRLARSGCSETFLGGPGNERS